MVFSVAGLAADIWCSGLAADGTGSEGARTGVHGRTYDGLAQQGDEPGGYG